VLNILLINVLLYLYFFKISIIYTKLGQEVKNES